MSTALEIKLYDALKRISKYRSPDQIRLISQKAYGLEAEEAIEYAYENVLSEAAHAIKGVRRPSATAAVQPTRSEKLKAAGFSARESITGAGGLLKEKFRD